MRTYTRDVDLLMRRKEHNRVMSKVELDARKFHPSARFNEATVSKNVFSPILVQICPFWTLKALIDTMVRKCTKNH